MSISMKGIKYYYHIRIPAITEGSPSTIKIHCQLCRPKTLFKKLIEYAIKPLEMPARQAADIKVAILVPCSNFPYQKDK